MGSELNGQTPDPDSDEFMIPPTIVPTGYRLRQVESHDGKAMAVALEIHTPIGVHVTFWPADIATSFGEELKSVGSACKVGLRLPKYS